MNIKLLLSIVILSIISSALTFISLSFFSPQTVQAAGKNEKLISQHFVLVDDEGNHRGGIGFEGKNPVIYLQDARGVARAYLGITSTGPILGLRNAKGKSDLVISTTDNCEPYILFNNRNEEKQLMLMLKDGIQPGIFLYDSNIKPRFILALNNDNPSMAFLDSNKSFQLSMQATDKQGVLFSFHDKSAAPSLAMGFREGKSFMYLHDKDGSGMLTAAQPGKGPALVLKDRGKITWAAGSGGTAADTRELERGIDIDGLTKDLLR